MERHEDVMRLHMSSRRSRLAGFSVSAYVVRGVLVDCGFPLVGSDVSQLLGSGGLRGVVVTHHHEDHAGNVEEVARRGIPIAAHPEALAAMREPAPIGAYRRLIWGEAPPLRSPVTPLFADDLQLVHTPGHSRDHLAVWDGETETLIAGDLFLGVKVRVAHDDEEPRVLLDSLRRAAALSPRRLFDGHRGSIPSPGAALAAKIAWLEETIGRIDGMAAEGTSEAEISRVVFGRRTAIDVFSRGEYSRLSLVRAVLGNARPAGQAGTR